MLFFLIKIKLEWYERKTLFLKAKFVFVCRGSRKIMHAEALDNFLSCLMELSDVKTVIPSPCKSGWKLLKITWVSPTLTESWHLPRGRSTSCSSYIFQSDLLRSLVFSITYIWIFLYTYYFSPFLHKHNIQTFSGHDFRSELNINRFM